MRTDTACVLLSQYYRKGNLNVSRALAYIGFFVTIILCPPSLVSPSPLRLVCVLLLPWSLLPFFPSKVYIPGSPNLASLGQALPYPALSSFLLPFCACSPDGWSDPANVSFCLFLFLALFLFYCFLLFLILSFPSFHPVSPFFSCAERKARVRDPQLWIAEHCLPIKRVKQGSCRESSCQVTLSR